MKATGIVRRIDDLGRVVIPKEIRRTMRIREGDPLEIYTEVDGEVIFKKYSPIGELADFATQICDTLNNTTGHVVAVSDRDTVIAVSGAPRKELLERRISSELEQLLESRRLYEKKSDEAMPIAEHVDKYMISIASPILSEGDVMGGVMFLVTSQAEKHGDVELKLAQTVSGFLGKQMES